VKLAVSPRPEDETVEVNVDPRAFDDAFPALYRHAYRVAYRLCGSDSDAKDLAQDALVRAYGRWDKIGAYADPSAWVARVVMNLAFDHWRRRRLFRRLPVASRDESVSDDHVDLYVALDSLPRRQRQVVVLRYLADQSEPATAQAMGCSVGAVKQHASRGLRALRARLDVPSLPEELP
jgi:RNA polymerase sigma-70 factor (sigma-E family)